MVIERLQWTDGENTESYTYNAAGLLSTVNTNTSTTSLTWDILYGDGVVISSVKDGETTDYTYGLERISASTGKARTEYVYDGRGSVIGEVTKTGLLSKAKVTTKAYTPFGEQIGEKAAGFGWNGEYFNATTGQVYLRARFYEPEMNRFGQKDILRGSISTPQTLNRYAYCINDPVNFVDPSGESLKGFFNTVKTAATAVVNTVSTAKIVVKETAAKVVKTAAQTVQTVKTVVKTTAIATAVAVGNSVVSSVSNKSGLKETLSNATQAAKATLGTGKAMTAKALNDGLNEIKQTTSVGKEFIKYVADNEIQKVKEAAKDVDWQKAAKIGSALEIAGGIVLCATGVGGAAGAALLGAGVSSLAGGYINKAQGGSFFAGWIGGEISGGLTGGGFGLGEVLKLGFAGTEVLALSSGFLGGAGGSAVSQKIDNGYVDTTDALNDGLINGLFAGVAGVFGQIPAAIKSAGAGAIGKVMSSGISLINEVIFDGFSSYFSSTNGASAKESMSDTIVNALYFESASIQKTACTR